jgi:hypothetical protein
LQRFKASNQRGLIGEANVAHDVAEMALANSVGEKVEAAYRAATCLRSGANDGGLWRVTVLSPHHQ